MGMRDAVLKMFGPGVPPAIEAANRAAGMDASTVFGPGEPIEPMFGFSRQPRSRDFTTGTNINARPRAHERISFGALRGIVEAYDIAQMCIWHRIDSVRSMDWNLTAEIGVEGDVTDAIAFAKRILKRPDGQLPFKAWVAKYLYDTLAYDAGCLYRMRNMAGQVIGLMPIDGTTIAPIIDDWGNQPTGEATAFVQYVQGVPANWLKASDLVYVPFRPRSNSVYGLAPIETVLLNANTDLRTQAYFLSRYTDGNVPEGFATAPEDWDAGQIAEFQETWDALMLGDDAAKHQVHWVPFGTSFAWSNEKDFSDVFSLHVMRKTAAAFHVVPADLGFTENVNKSSGDTQADVQFRVGDLPLVQHVEGVITDFLQHDLGLPLSFHFDTGQETKDRLQTAQAMDAYVKMGAISISEVRENEFGLSEPEGQTVPRFIYTQRAGPIPLSALFAVAGQTDKDTGAPEPGAALPHKPFAPIEGVAPQTPPNQPPLAVQRYPADNPSSVVAAIQSANAPVTKSETVGITADTGIVGNPLIDDEGDEDQAAARQDIAKAEVLAFGRFTKARRRKGTWRDFDFTAVPPLWGHRLNDAGRAQIRKAAGQLVAAGLCVRALDTGRVLMLQRGIDLADPASGLWEFPGGHIETDETPYQAACREWMEETGLGPLPMLASDGSVDIRPPDAEWRSGVYAGYVLNIDSEIPLGERLSGCNPDDPDGDWVEAVAWWDPQLLVDNPSVRSELADSLRLVFGALGNVSKAGGPPKVVSAWHSHAARQFDAKLVDYHTEQIAQALGGMLTTSAVKRAITTYAAKARD